MWQEEATRHAETPWYPIDQVQSEVEADTRAVQEMGNSLGVRSDIHAHHSPRALRWRGSGPTAL
jgi:hypothetical protein